VASDEKVARQFDDKHQAKIEKLIATGNNSELDRKGAKEGKSEE
jgi:hypothetical protein